MRRAQYALLTTLCRIIPYSSFCLRAIPIAAKRPLMDILSNDNPKDGTVFTSLTAVIVIGYLLLFSLDSETVSSVSTAR